MTARVSRGQIIETLAGALSTRPEVRAAWLGGSDASGRTDEWSDVDLQVLVEDDHVEGVFACVVDALVPLSPIALRYRLPRPTWHGHDQEFLSLRDADPCHFLDLVVVKLSSADRFLDEERHGRPLVLFDRGEFARPMALDRTAHAARMAARLAVIRVTFPLFQNLVTKAVRRGMAADALNSYLGATLRPLVELLRMRYAPDRFDYGLRYLDRDLPPALAAEIDRLALPGSLEQVESFRARAETLFTEHLAALDR